MRHRYIAVLLEQKRKELGEGYGTFGMRLFPESDLHTARSKYSSIAHQKIDISEARLVQASEVLGIPLDTLKKI